MNPHVCLAVRPTSIPLTIISLSSTHFVKHIFIKREVKRNHILVIFLSTILNSLYIENSDTVWYIPRNPWDAYDGKIYRSLIYNLQK